MANVIPGNIERAGLDFKKFSRGDIFVFAWEIQIFGEMFVLFERKFFFRDLEQKKREKEFNVSVFYFYKNFIPSRSVGAIYLYFTQKKKLDDCESLEIFFYSSFFFVVVGRKKNVPVKTGLRKTRRW